MSADPISPSAALYAALKLAQTLSEQGEDLQAIDAIDRALHELDGGCAEDAETAVPRALALALKGQSLSRRARFDEAIRVFASAPRALSGPRHVEARVCILLGMGFACTHHTLPQQAIKLGDAALRLALADRQMPLAALALECIGTAYGMDGDLGRADGMLHEALGVALQSGADAVIHRCLNNLLFLSQNLFDQRRARGELDVARDALTRCARFVAHGDRLAARVGAYERCRWRRNRAGWQLRRGNLDDARAACLEVSREATARGWPVILAFAQLDLAHVHFDAGDEAAALAAIDTVLQHAPENDRYELRLRSHQLAQTIFTTQRRPVDAAVHGLAHRRLMRERELHRTRVAAWLPQLGDAVLSALDEAEHARIAGEDDAARKRRLDALAAEYLRGEWTPTRL